MTVRRGSPSLRGTKVRRPSPRRKAAERSPPESSPATARILLVPGDEEVALHEIARFLEKLEQRVLIFEEQPNLGRTEIEKVEQTAIDFAVVLLAPSDRGGAAGVGFDQQQPRAGQRVILELGRLSGILGRDRVFALYRPGLEIPSTDKGLLYVELDSGGGWKLQLARELRAHCGVDMNKAL